MGGKFHCQLCPSKVLLNEKDLELHVQSKSHKKNEMRFEHAKSLGVEAYEAECRARAEAREALASGENSKRKAKNVAYWEKKRGISQKAKQKKVGKSEKRADKSVNITQDDIERRKQLFQAKKARR